jgi:hypothetical protein
VNKEERSTEKFAGRRRHCGLFIWLLMTWKNEEIAFLMKFMHGPNLEGVTNTNSG